ncbi:MAG: YebC/PmpR family DNA-binding transcriptional regulator [Caldilineales bacterium]|nr:YebC/PmpR family DNA-binding transcriptional regulator [Caldilineales bacterium]
MSGHSKWANIKRRKESVDARRGKIFTRIARELQVAARAGGPDPEMNLRLRLVLDKAKAANMPKDNIERAIARGAGLEKGDELEEVTYEGYASSGVALLIETMTDNRNRTVAEIRHVLTKGGGSMASAGSVAWQFDRKGQLIVAANGRDQEEVFLEAIDAGAEDVYFNEDGSAEIVTADIDLAAVRDRLHAAGYTIESAELTMVAQNEVDLPAEETLKILGVLERLEDLDDVQRVHSNLAIDDALIAEFEAA